VDKSYCFSSFLLGLIFNILLSLGHLKTFTSGHELPLHFSITLRSAPRVGGGCIFIYMCSSRRIRLLLKSIAFMVIAINNFQLLRLVTARPGLCLITTLNNFEIKRMMSHLVLKLCITTLKVIYCYVYCKYKSLLVVPKIPIVRIV
jgi:hypothetical protein